MEATAEGNNSRWGVAVVLDDLDLMECKDFRHAQWRQQDCRADPLGAARTALVAMGSG